MSGEIIKSSLEDIEWLRRKVDETFSDLRNRGGYFHDGEVHRGLCVALGLLEGKELDIFSCTGMKDAFDMGYIEEYLACLGRC